MQIREATNGDFDELMQLYTVTNRIINERNGGFNPENDVFRSCEMVTEAIANGEQLIGVEGGKIALAVIINNKSDDAYNTVKWKVDASPDEFWVIHALRVLPEYEGRGFAKQMLAHIIRIAPERGIKSLRLDILVDYGVENLYRKFDFEYIDTVEIFYEDIGQPEKFKLLERVI